VSIGSTFVFGLMPALQMSRQRPADALRDATRGSSGGVGRQRFRSALTVAEVALSVSLLIGAGLLLRSFARLQQVDAGFDVAPLMAMRTNLPRTTYTTGAQMAAFYERLLNDMRSLPGVLGAATSSGVPLSVGNTSTGVRLLHRPTTAGETPSADWRLVSPGYFATMGIPLRGRDFSMSDRADTPGVTIISEAMARRYWPNQDPIGQTVGLRSFGESPQTIIGVAGDVRSAGLDSDPAPMVYGSAMAFGGWNPMHVVWRSAVDPASHAAAFRDTVRRIDPTVPVYDVQRLTDLRDLSFGPRRFNMYLLGVFAAVAVALAAIGLFGVMAYLVSQRTREIGVRLALGANRGQVFRLVLGRGLVLAVAGSGVGVLGALWLTRLMENLLFSVSTRDPGTFAAVPIAVVAVALVACYIPARRATRVDPVTALRAE
ncbi:MAG: ABC transporter permease, partial [Planctomycetota bacterium]|nr:ABC transporter permease [Planctomycetota bacterium]